MKTQFNYDLFKDVCRQAQISITELARELHVNRRSIQKWSNPNCPILPNVKHLILLAKYCRENRVKMTEILAEREEE